MVRSAAAVGIPTFADLNAELMEAPGGCAIVNVAIKDGRRHSVFSNYLQPILDRPNITILTNTLVQKVVLDRMTATGVVLQFGDEAWLAEVAALAPSGETRLGKDHPALTRAFFAGLWEGSEVLSFE